MLPCTCGVHPTIHDVKLGGQSGPWVITCPNCYDGTESSFISTALDDLEEAVDYWNEQIEEAMYVSAL